MVPGLGVVQVASCGGLSVAARQDPDLRSLLAQISGDGTPTGAMEGLPNLKEFFGLIGPAEIDELGRQFSHG